MTADARDPLGRGCPIRLRLYVAGDAPNSLRAKHNLQDLLKSWRELPIHLEMCDVLDDPEGALRDGVIITPMLVRIHPQPVRKVFGDLRDHDLVRAILHEVLE